MNPRRILIALTSLFLLASSLSVAAQKKSDPKKEDAKRLQEAKKKEEAQAKARSRQLEEANKAMKKWIDEDATYIITNEERATWKNLKTDEERESFIESFWLRRDPSPDTIDNEYRDDHYE